MADLDDLLSLARSWADRASEAANDRRHGEAHSAAAVSGAYSALAALARTERNEAERANG